MAWCHYYSRLASSIDSRTIDYDYCIKIGWLQSALFILVMRWAWDLRLDTSLTLSLRSDKLSWAWNTYTKYPFTHTHTPFTHSIHTHQHMHIYSHTTSLSKYIWLGLRVKIAKKRLSINVWYLRYMHISPIQNITVCNCMYEYIYRQINV